MPLQFQLVIDGEVQFDRTFSRFTENLTDLRHLWPGVIIELRQAEREQFSGEGVGPTGRWKPLSKAYGKWKAKHYPGKQINQRSGRLIDALTGNTSDTLIDPQPDSLTYGVRIPYAIHVHRKRKVFDLNEQQKTRLMKTIQRRLLQAGKNAGFALG